MNIRSLLIAATAMTAIAGTASAQNSATVNSKATFVQAAAVTNATDLDFGTVTVPNDANSGTVTLTAADNRTASSNISLIGGAGGGTPGTFQLAAATGTNVTLAVTPTPAGSFGLAANGVSGGTGCAGAAIGNFQLTSTSCTVSLGAVLTVPSGTTPGSNVNVGSFAVTFNYQ